MSKVAAGDASTRLVATAIGSIGVVFGDIGTSPLYTLQVAADAQGGGGLTRDDVFGVVSLILWALILAVSVKYVTFVMRADNRGEGGILALLALLRPTETAGTSVIALLVIAGAALLFGDGLITPAISVLSALEGLQMAAPGFEPYIVPLTCAVLLVLFAVQRRGTGGLGALFGPVMVVWFTTIGALGLHEILKNGEILGAVSPIWGARYFARHGLHGLGILGVVVLAITGGEALYADMGHFGPRPIRLSWFSLVLPALALSYLGQGALILRDPRALANPFFAMVPPGPATYALVALAAMATTIASQALISGVFSLTHQAVQLGYFPRVTIRHTSREAEGQIYVPLMNWGLMAGSIALVLAFRHSARLGAAYGIAVSGTMAITSVVFFEVTRKAWRWPAARSVPLLLLFLSFDLPFFGANLLKFVDGGYIPILVGALFFVMMLDWHVGRQVLREILGGSQRAVRRIREFAGVAQRGACAGNGDLPVHDARGTPHARNAGGSTAVDHGAHRPSYGRGRARAAGRRCESLRSRIAHAGLRPRPRSLRVHGKPARPARSRASPRGERRRSSARRRNVLRGPRDGRRRQGRPHGAGLRRAVRILGTQRHERDRPIRVAARPGGRVGDLAGPLRAPGGRHDRIALVVAFAIYMKR